MQDPTTLTETNFTKIYYYNSNGNRTDVKTFLYGQEDYIPATPPTAYSTNSGAFNIFVVVSGDKTLDVGDTLSLSYSYYLLNYNMPPNPTTIPMRTACDYSSVDTSTDGYYLLECTGFVKLGGATYNLDFGVVITVGTPISSLRTPQEHIHYNFSSSWENQLISYGEMNWVNGVQQAGATIQEYIYDTVSNGNPVRITNFMYNEIVYDYATLEWDGRQLSIIELHQDNSDDTYQISYKYNDQGYRTEKAFYTITNSIEDLTETISYTLMNDKVIYETNGEYGILYTYDYDGTIISFNYDSNVENEIHGFEYFYIRNQMGDITHIVNSSGIAVVHYIYDAYGNWINDISTNPDIANINPYRYRGYRYDSEINMYYLNSRYYDSEVSRFINSDGMLGQFGDIQSSNMYAYCANNPVNYIDPSGNKFFGYAMLISIAISLGIEIYQDLHEDGEFNIGWNYLGAAVSGYFSGLAGKFWASAAYSFIGGALDYFISGEYNEDTVYLDMGVLIISSIISGGLGKLAYNQVSLLKGNALSKLSANKFINRKLTSMGLGFIKNGCLKQGVSLGKTIANSNKYFFGNVIRVFVSKSSGEILSSIGLLKFD